ncbi:MAG: YggS family pyridoxal phosphate-dependent enzyme [Proteobacteria bacterium]|nr:YggS family pyridoxal phosphate-dependent enzyme [Pseudomonadota bacterium]
MICSNLKKIQNEINEVCRLTGREESSVKLLAVSKTVEVERIKEAVDCGHLVFGENYIQEAKDKIPALVAAYPDQHLEFHFIGHLQRNKAKEAVALFDFIHTVDKIELAKEIGKQAAKISKRQKILLQINISGEESKSGVNPDDIATLLEEILADENLEVVGLMCIGSFFSEEEAEDVRASEFKKMSLIKSQLEAKYKVRLEHLSMGMSHDFPLAIKEGSTMVRVGTAIFGARN